jgi:hypothetical protein
MNEKRRQWPDPRFEAFNGEPSWETRCLVQKADTCPVQRRPRRARELLCCSSASAVESLIIKLDIACDPLVLGTHRGLCDCLQQRYEIECMGATVMRCNVIICANDKSCITFKHINMGQIVVQSWINYGGETALKTVCNQGNPSTPVSFVIEPPRYYCQLSYV